MSKITGTSRLLTLSSGVRLLIGIALSILSALLLTYSMPPFGWWPLALVGYVPAQLAQYRILPRKLSSLGSAIAISGLVALYIMDAFIALPGAPWYMRLLPLIFGVFIFLTDTTARSFNAKSHYRHYVLFGAAGWVGVEMIRGFIPMLGTWGFISYSFYKVPALIQPISIFSIYGLSLLIMLVNFTLGLAALRWFDTHWKLDADEISVPTKTSRRWLLGTGAGFVAWLVLSLILFSPSGTGETVTAAAIQPNHWNLYTTEEAKVSYLSPERWDEVTNIMKDRMFTQTEDAAAQGAELIVWPEGGLMVDPQKNLISQELTALAKQSEAYLAVAYGADTRNEVTMLSPDGQFMGVYGKNHPVLFVQESSSTRGTYPVFESDLGTLGAMICYDADFTDTTRKIARNGATIIAMPSGDWSEIGDKHYAHTVFRAVENRVAIVKADRTYDSVIIDPYGRIVNSAISIEGSQQTVIGAVALVNQLPLQTRLGDWVGWIALAGLGFYSIYPALFKQSKPQD